MPWKLPAHPATWHPNKKFVFPRKSLYHFHVILRMSLKHTDLGLLGGAMGTRPESYCLSTPTALAFKDYPSETGEADAVVMVDVPQAGTRSNFGCSDFYVGCSRAKHLLAVLAIDEGVRDLFA